MALQAEIRRHPVYREIAMATASLSTADVLERCAGDLHSVAFDFREPAPMIAVVERRIGEVERILEVARAAVRGKR